MGTTRLGARRLLLWGQLYSGLEVVVMGTTRLGARRLLLWGQLDSGLEGCCYGDN